MTTFKIGDKVKCINKSVYQYIEVGKIYTVINKDRFDNLYLKEIEEKHLCKGFKYNRKCFEKAYSLKDRLNLIKELIK
jgi:hypothetical protein